MATKPKRGAKPVPPPQPSSSTYPYVHVGHGISAARKDWSLLVVLREPLAVALPRSAPEPLDTLSAKQGSQIITAGHHNDSLQWVVAASYPDPDVDEAEASEKTSSAQWKAFNDDIDDFLAQLHQRAPIAVVVRPIDDEYSTTTSPWHDWSCAELPGFLPFLASVLTNRTVKWYLEHACDLWRWRTSQLPVEEQGQLIAAVPETAMEVFERFGGAPEVETPPPPDDERPTLDDQLRVWSSIPPAADVFEAFDEAFGHLVVGGRKWSLDRFMWALEEDLTTHAALLVDVAHRALSSPRCVFPDTHWRPYLLNGLVALGRFDEAKCALPVVAMSANNYSSTNWKAVIGYLDAVGRSDQADVLYRTALRYGADVTPKRKAKAARAEDMESGSILMLELLDPFFADMASTNDDVLHRAAFQLEYMVKKEAIAKSVLGVAGQARDVLKTRADKRRAEALERFAAGEALDETMLATLLAEYYPKPSDLTAEQVQRLATAAVSKPALTVSLESLAYAAHAAKLPTGRAIYQIMVTAPIHPEHIDRGRPRASWLRAANALMVIAHAEKEYDASARYADMAAPYARENRHITHAAACAYVAVNRLDDAMQQVRLAAELAYENLDALRTDADLGPLLERDDFKALFAKKKRR